MHTCASHHLRTVLCAPLLMRCSLESSNQYLRTYKVFIPAHKNVHCFWPCVSTKDRFFCLVRGCGEGRGRLSRPLVGFFICRDQYSGRASADLWGSLCPSLFPDPVPRGFQPQRHPSSQLHRFQSGRSPDSPWFSLPELHPGSSLHTIN